MSQHIVNATLDDLQVIYRLFDEAILFQKSNNYVGWLNYDKEYIQKDIKENLLYKIMSGSDIVCIFSICYSDPLIWREKEKGDAIYLHRVVLNRSFEGKKIFQTILNWVIDFAKAKALTYIRMDTWSDNEKLITYYKSYGFSFVEHFTTDDTDSLPLQHRNLRVALLELHLSSIHKQSAQQQQPILQKVNILDALSTIDKYWSQKTIGQANGQLIKLAKGTGEIHWHHHDDQDELFIVYKGHLTMQLRDADVELYPNDLFIVPRGVEHCPKAHGEVDFLIMGLNITSNAAGGRPSHFN